MLQNITIVTSYFAPAWCYGGPPRVLYTLAKELAKNGKTVKVITTDVLDKKRNKNHFEILDGIEIYRFNTISNLLAYRTKLFIVTDILNKAKKIIDKSEIVFFSDVRAIINWQLYSYAFQRGIPYGIFAFGEIPYGEGIKSIVKKVFDRLWVRDFVQRASFRFAQTKHEQQMYEQYFRINRLKTQRLLLPVEQKKIRVSHKSSDDFRKKWKISNDDKILLFVGRLHYLKGIDILINAVKPLMDKDKGLKLIIVGRDDGEEKKIRKMSKDVFKNQIIFTGPMYGEDIVNIYNVATCFVFTPRHYEETPLAALEALQFGLPVVSTREAEIPFLEQYRAGFIVDNNPISIGDAISKILEQTTQKNNILKKQAHKLIQDHYLPTKIAGTLLYLLEKNNYYR